MELEEAVVDASVRTGLKRPAWRWARMETLMAVDSVGVVELVLCN